ncbi:MAG: type II toxin-antitoxin system RelE/ParE family toxin [Propionibacteriaceae bacterium]|nr:type II toxin-antitoxin system RelE/ParE family toxin [Propionibacteriaceae bacterium]
MVYSDQARKQLKKLDALVRNIILSWMNKHIAGCDNPRAHGKGLTANRSNQWRYRIGNYRLLCDIQDDRLVVLALNVKHRSQV